MSKKKFTANQLAWGCSFIGSYFDFGRDALGNEKTPTFDDLRNRIRKNRGNKFRIYPQNLAWTRKIQPLKRWDNMWELFDGPDANSWNRKGKDGCLAISRHSRYWDALKEANYVKNIKNIDYITSGTIYLKKGPLKLGLFWLINEDDSPFVYAILKSSMFKAWCSLTANTDGDSHFTEGMWNTFPLPALSKDQKDRIIKAGKNQEQLDKIVDALFNLHNATDEKRKNMLAKGFEKTFRDVK